VSSGQASRSALEQAADPVALPTARAALLAVVARAAPQPERTQHVPSGETGEPEEQTMIANGSAPRHHAVVLTESLRDRLLTEIRERHPRKTYGYLLSATDPARPTDFVSFKGNIRNSPDWRWKFHSFGRYFVDHDDAGFVTTPEESWLVEQEIAARGLDEVALFHTHLRHPANFSGVDYELHVARFERLWHLIVSMRNPELPQLRAYDVSVGGVRELPLSVAADHEPAGAEVISR
jgi:proteasome lid subunit RPN8/RPN11